MKAAMMNRYTEQNTSKEKKPSFLNSLKEPIP